MGNEVFKTAFQLERERKHLAIYTDYKQLMRTKGQSKTVVHKHLMEKYGIHSPSTIYVILKKFESRAQKGGEK